MLLRELRIKKAKYAYNLNYLSLILSAPEKTKTKPKKILIVSEAKQPDKNQFFFFLQNETYVNFSQIMWNFLDYQAKGFQVYHRRLNYF